MVGTSTPEEGRRTSPAPEAGGVYRSWSGQTRRVIRFNGTGNRLLYRQEGHGQGKPVPPVGTERWVSVGTFRSWAVERLA